MQCKLLKRCPKVSSASTRSSFPPAELDAKVNARLDELKDRVRINGFRPGKVPVTHLKRMYGRSAMAEVIEATVRDTNNQDCQRARIQARCGSESHAADRGRCD